MIFVEISHIIDFLNGFWFGCPVSVFLFAFNCIKNAAYGRGRGCSVKLVRIVNNIGMR